MTTDGGKKGGTNEAKYTEKDPMALNQHTAPKCQVGPSVQNHSSLRGVDSMENQGEQPPHLGSELPGNYRRYRSNYRDSCVLGWETSNGQ